MSNNSKGINIILYPREYNKRGNDSLHSVRGVTSAGDEINVKLRVPEKYKTHGNHPTIADLASKDIKSLKYCLASEFNSPKNREGILLFSGAKKEPSKNNKMATYIASWVEVLSNSANAPDPIYGFGRMEINEKSKKTSSLNKQLNFHIENNSPQELIEDLEKELINPKNYSYSVIHYISKKIQSFSLSDKSRLKDYFTQIIDVYTKRGRVGGVMIRAIDRDGLVIKSSYKEYFPKYSLVSSGVQVGKLTYENYRRDLENILKIKGVSQFELMPLVKITTGPKSSEYYGESDRFNRLKRTFFDKNGLPVVCKIVSRVTEYRDSETALLYKAFPLSIPLGHPAKLNKDNLLALQFESEGSQSKFDADGLNLEGIKIGLTRNTKIIKRAYWLLGESDDSAEYYSEVLKSNETESNISKEDEVIDIEDVSHSKEDDIQIFEPEGENSIHSIIESEGVDIDELFFTEDSMPENTTGSIEDNNEEQKEAENTLDLEVSNKEEQQIEKESQSTGLTGMAAFLARRNS